jgi:DNA-binding NtrC family response regulator
MDLERAGKLVIDLRHIYIPPLHSVIIYHLQKSQERMSSINIKEEEDHSSVTMNKRNKILIVDDEPDVTFSLKIGLEDKGFVVECFNDPVSALSNFRAGLYDLVLLDVKMPRINGFELYEKIKQIDSKIKSCFITANEVYYESLREIFPTIDRCDCYVKPIKIEDLVRRVKAQIDG